MKIVMVELDKIVLRPKWNIRNRKTITKSSIESLKASIEAIGLQEPLILNDKHELVAGNRRYLACQILNLKKVPCHVQTFASENHERLAHLDENLESQSLQGKDFDFAIAERKEIYVRLFPESKKVGRKKGDKGKKSFEKETAEKTGKSEKTIRRSIKRVNDVTSEVREAYENDEINSGQIDELVKLPKEKQNKILAKIKGASVAETELKVRDALEKEKPHTDEDTIKDVTKAVKMFNVKLQTLIDTKAYNGISDKAFEAFNVEFSTCCDLINEILEDLETDDEQEKDDELDDNMELDFDDSQLMD